MKIVVDSREQRPWEFLPPHVTVRATVETGDYTLPSLEKFVGIERKSIDDFVNCCGKERDRFMREMARAAPMPFFCVIVEASLDDIHEHRYRPQTAPASVIGTALGIYMNYGIPVYFAGTRPLARDLAERFLKQIWEREEKGYRAEYRARAKARMEEVRAKGKLEMGERRLARAVEAAEKEVERRVAKATAVTTKKGIVK